jgi:hypothetical protein
MKYKIIRTIEPDGTWFRAHDESDHFVLGTVSHSIEECEERLRIALVPVSQEVVKELEID